jgi:hypothetical protein
MTVRRAHRRPPAFLLLVCVVLVPPAFAQVQTKDQQKCTVGMGKNLQKVTSALATDIATCMKDGSKQKLGGTVEACAAADAKGKVAAATEKTTEDFTKLCTGTSKGGSPKLPPYGVVDADAVDDAGRAKEPALFHDVFGPDLDAALLLESADKDGAKCQQAVATSAKKCQDATLKTWVTCVALGLKDDDAPFEDAADLEACLGADPQGKIAKACDLREETSPGKLEVDGIRKALDTQCLAKGVDLAEAIPGCEPGDVEATHACVDAAVECRACLALNAAAGLARDCDLFDDGAANGSCGEPSGPVIGQHTCTLDAETSGFFFETSIFSDLFLLEGEIDVDCGAVDASGHAPCTCSLGDFPPVPIIPGIGVACVNPAPGCPTGQIGCNGGEARNSVLTSDHDIGTCTSNADCAAQCATRCGDADVWDSGCEGFCRGGTNDDEACASDDDCPGGSCIGIDDGEHGNVCQCECLDAAGAESRPGALRYNVGVDIDVELAAPCGDGDLLFSVGRRCVPFTTETAQGTVLDANAEAGEVLPPDVNILEGLPLECAELAADGTSGMSLVSGANALDVDLAGDIAFLFFLHCQ